MMYWVRMEHPFDGATERFFDYSEEGEEACREFIFGYMKNGWRVAKAEIRNGSGVLWFY